MLLAMPLPVPDFNLSFVLFYNPSLGKNKYANNFQVFLFGQQLPPRVRASVSSHAQVIL